MGRVLRTQLPQMEDNFVPKWPHMQLVKEKHAEYKAKQTHDYKSHCVSYRPILQEGTEVWINNDSERGEKTRGEVRAPVATSRSHIVDTPSGQLRWNSRHLVPVS